MDSLEAEVDHVNRGGNVYKRTRTLKPAGPDWAPTEIVETYEAVSEVTPKHCKAGA